MQIAHTEDDAQRILQARKKTVQGKITLDEARQAIASSQILTEKQMTELEVCPTLSTKDYILFLVNDTSNNEPVCIFWAYAEKLQDNSGFLFSYGSGNNKTGMKIHTCAQFSMDSAMRNATYKFGGELDDQGDEITLKSELTDEQFASRITDIVNGDGGGRKRMVIASTEDDLQALTEKSSQDAYFDDDDDDDDGNAGMNDDGG